MFLYLCVLQYSIYNFMKFKTILYSSTDISIDFLFSIYFTSEINKCVYLLPHCH
jgi:hypothetical protein